MSGKPDRKSKQDEFFEDIDAEVVRPDETSDLRQHVQEQNRIIEELSSEVLRKKYTGGGNAPPEVYPLILLLVIVCWMVIYVEILNYGLQRPSLGTVFDACFGVLALAVTCKWIETGWTAQKWIIIPKAAIAFVVMVIAADRISDGRIWEAVLENPEGHPWQALGLVGAGLLFAASPAVEYGLFATINFLAHPMMTINKERIK